MNNHTMSEPTMLLVDGDVHGQYSIDRFIERYVDIAKFAGQAPECPIDLDDHSFWADRHNEQFRAYAHEVDECLLSGEVSIIVKGVEWCVEWSEGDIIAINPLSDWDEHSETYIVYGDIKKELMDYLLPEQIEAIEEAILPEVKLYFDEGEEEVRAAVLVYFSYNLQYARETMECFLNLYDSEVEFWKERVALIELGNEDNREYISCNLYRKYHYKDYLFLGVDGKVAVFVKA